MSKYRKQPKRRSLWLGMDMDEVNDACETSNTKRGKMLKLPTEVKKGSSTVYNSHYSGNTSYNYESHLHKGLDVIYERTQGSVTKQLFAGNGRGVDEYSGAWDLIIDLANNLSWSLSDGTIKSKSADRFNVLKKYVAAPKQIKSEILSLDWPDGGVIPAGLDFWIKLWSLLPEKSVMMCIGGHGRTGTCMVALMIAAGESYYDALEAVRVKHCKKAVETVGQTKYLHGLYYEACKRNLAWAKKEKPEFVTKWEEELAYVESHVPNHHSDYGDPEPPKPATTTHTRAYNGEVTGADLDGSRLKLVANQLYEQICVDAVCKQHDCRQPDHQGWVLYDPELAMTN